MKRSDRVTAIIIAAAIILLVSSYALFRRPAGNTAVVSVDGVETARIDLLERTPRTLEVHGTSGVLLLEVPGDGSVRVIQAPCPDQICVHTKAARTAGDTIICVPNRVVIAVIGRGEVPDAVAQ